MQVRMVVTAYSLEVDAASQSEFALCDTRRQDTRLPSMMGGRLGFRCIGRALSPASAAAHILYLFVSECRHTTAQPYHSPTTAHT